MKNKTKFAIGQSVTFVKRRHSFSVNTRNGRGLSSSSSTDGYRWAGIVIDRIGRRYWVEYTNARGLTRTDVADVADIAAA